VKDASIAVHFDFSSSFLEWNVSFIKVIHNWEVVALASFFTLLYSYRVRWEGEYKIL
jgi:hypothetical protein